MSDNKIVGYVLMENAGFTAKPKILKQTSKTITYQTVLQEGDAENRNGRVYPCSIIESGFNSPFVQERLRTNSWKGEAEHPMGDNKERLFRINPDNTSHFIKDWFRQDNLFYGIIQTAPTQRGRELMDMILEVDMIAAKSLRASGPVRKEKGRQVVCGPFRMITYDCVNHPSHKPAYMDCDSPVPLTESDMELLGKNDSFLMENADFITDLKDVDFEVMNLGESGATVVANQNGSKVAINASMKTKYDLRDILGL